MNLDQNQTFLFQGDSITDCGRNRAVQDNPNDLGALGFGYACRIASDILAEFPHFGLRMFNRGVSGNRVVDLYARWKADGINLKPDWISILIGVNDTWHEFGSANGVEIDRFEQVYRMLLDFTKQRLPRARLVLCEPFVLPCGVVTSEWEVDIRARQAVVKRLSEEYSTFHVPFQLMFDEALSEAPAEYWAGDGVHPSAAGQTRMAQFWRSRVGI
jgi:lysophospholipase L1-like esterase